MLPVNVTLQDLTIRNARALGGAGRDNGGGGAGLGGVLFIANRGTVTLRNVQLDTNSARGGPGGANGIYGGGGGGGLGGFGGQFTGGGGGGAGMGATGGNGGVGQDGSAGIMVGLPPGGRGAGGRWWIWRQRRRRGRRRRPDQRDDHTAAAAAAVYSASPLPERTAEGAALAVAAAAPATTATWWHGRLWWRRRRERHTWRHRHRRWRLRWRRRRRGHRWVRRRPRCHLGRLPRRRRWCRLGWCRVRAGGRHPDPGGSAHDQREHSCGGRGRRLRPDRWRGRLGLRLRDLPRGGGQPLTSTPDAGETQTIADDYHGSERQRRHPHPGTDQERRGNTHALGRQHSTAA